MEKSEKVRLLREFRRRSKQALQQEDYSERSRMCSELLANPKYEEVLIQHWGKQLEQEMDATSKRMLTGEQEPNIARCVLATMEDLRSIGLWDGSENTSYKRALGALEAYQRLEKKRVEFLATKAAYEKAAQEYRDTKELLGSNLVRKWLQPLRGSAADPMKWYLTAQEIVELRIWVIRHRTSGEEEPRRELSLSVATLRKYQSLGLIPKPIRMGRQSRYSVLTLIRLAIIEVEKEQGFNLKDINPARIEKLLKDTLDSYDSFAQSRPPTPEEMTVYYMTLLINIRNEELAKQFEGALDRRIDELRAKKQGG